MDEASYGVDAPKVLRNLFLAGFGFLLLSTLTPKTIHMGNVDFDR